MVVVVGSIGGDEGGEGRFLCVCDSFKAAFFLAQFCRVILANDEFFIVKLDFAQIDAMVGPIDHQINFSA